MVARPAQIHATSVGQRESSDTSNNVSASPSEPIGTVSPIPTSILVPAEASPHLTFGPRACTEKVLPLTTTW